MPYLKEAGFYRMSNPFYQMPDPTVPTGIIQQINENTLFCGYERDV